MVGTLGVLAGAGLALTFLPPLHVPAPTGAGGMKLRAPESPKPAILIASSHLPVWSEEGGKGGWARARSRAALNDPPGA